jgi:DNA-binding CsgD family transcriptional regulator
MHPPRNTVNDTKLEILEAAYGHGEGQADWLRHLGQTFRGSVPAAVSCFCYEVFRADGRLQLGRSWAEDPKVAAQLKIAFDQTPPALVDMFCTTPLQAATTREVLQATGIAMESTPLLGLYEQIGYADVFAMMATNPAGQGVVLGVGLARPGGPSPHERVEWIHVAAHVAAARRLQVKLAGISVIEQASAVLGPDGRVEHIASGESEEPDIAAILRDAVKQVEHARKHARSDAEALTLWQGLVAGRWSLVEQFESDGRRYYVAVRNPTDTVKIHALTRRESEVAAHVASGLTTKVTAYALGLDEVTVRGYLHAAMTKLGLRSRPELVALRAALEPGADALAQS